MIPTRRNVIKAVAAAPFFLPSRIWAAETAPSDRIGVGFIGMGIQSRGLLTSFLYEDGVRVVAVCDVDTTRREAARDRVDAHYAALPATGRPGCVAYNDFRELLARRDVDAVCIATPDHWHAIVTLAALRAGKDVYCEKPLTETIHEAVEVMKAVDANGRVLQTGSMQRSMKEFRVACELVRNGAIGRLERVLCSFGDPPVPCHLPEEPMEFGLDWDTWLGPAPARPYSSVLSPRGLHDFFPDWRLFREYGGGMVTDWGAHHLDIAQWGLGMDASGPVEVRPSEKAGAKRGATLVYANGVTVTHVDGFGVEFQGTEGVVQVHRGQFTLTHRGRRAAWFTDREDGTSCEGQVAIAEREFLKDARERLYVSTDHVADFLGRVRDRRKPIASEQVGGRSVICCHLMNLAYEHRTRLQWDPAVCAFASGTGDPRWLTREYRAPWSV
jgi:predicted dehydrogenase